MPLTSGRKVMSAVVEVHGLTKAFDGNQVLRGLDFTLRAGEILCLLGPNGSGKTTTLDILQGFVRPDGGAVRVLGQDPLAGDIRRLRERVGVVLQESGFPNFLRVGEMIDTWRSYYANPLPRDELIDLVQLEGQHDQLVRKMSGGQRRRLDFALAVAGDPEVILLDEPTTGFDPESRSRCWEAVMKLRERGKAILLTTHYLDEAERLADRVAIMKDGTITASGTVDELARQCGLEPVVNLPLGAYEHDFPEHLGLDIRSGVLSGRVGDYPELLTALAGFARDGGATAIRSLRIAPPSLEDCYLKLVGSKVEGER
jgi:ABC-2 type transport system ATP-binding protein